MATMRSAWLVEPGTIELREVERPVPDRGDVVIRVEAALTCGTDLKAYRRGHHLIPMPGPFGHEYAGVVVDAGPGAAFAPGDAVMGVHSAPCGDCYWCRRRQGNLCPTIMESKVLGAYAEYLLIPSRIARVNLFPKPDSLSFAKAALLEPLSCVVHGLRDAEPAPDEKVLIIGAGAIGLLHLATLRAAGCEEVWVAGRRPFRLETAKAMGAAHTVAVEREDLPEAVREWTHGRGADVVIECTGDPAVWAMAPWLCRRGGRVILFGGLPGGASVSFDAARLHYDEIALHSPFHFTPEDVAEARRLLIEDLAGVERLITDALPLSAVARAFAWLGSRECFKYAILPWAEEEQLGREAL